MNSYAISKNTISNFPRFRNSGPGAKYCGTHVGAKGKTFFLHMGDISKIYFLKTYIVLSLPGPFFYELFHRITINYCGGV